jgi:hypothetical protein
MPTVMGSQRWTASGLRSKREEDAAKECSPNDGRNDGPDLIGALIQLMTAARRWLLGPPRPTEQPKEEIKAATQNIGTGQIIADGHARQARPCPSFIFVRRS